jgi:hypothetical protein
MPLKVSIILTKRICCKIFFKDLFSHGKIISGCGREFLFADKNSSYEEAHNYCCSLNMRLLTVERLDMLDCLTRMIDKFPKASETLFPAN